ncbi:MAG: glutamine--fructose-6-phosphate transaminase (isomerizing) [Bacteroidales bacterium]|jgi:glucosamine--fructose-6-phosphate aminotransferase (isomerizing)|nr:glutamine--fructose-6-phosphate transaminase (isomerizing) [Bacteroidales bacterium]MEE1020706.1 glutamine--fructose-6-phosphate transaminase (isomerizing) [Bacteroidales bacterium]MEE1221370.1 glutamine--fructose-6-phosphate transaminase (isomerizing) [Bacteroidales bacterium]MEE1251581.1 glutamine--fructose-6-phosphate transaminase (isomerizing) [Bacteroidales bacterium]MEE1323851.1 glutamine--fructose-6-phosphate transaminase (isomerizing) [Bacteroidales bacterium]
MCGIVGYIGTREAYPILIKGLHRLEYRGYDSAGVALLNSAGELNVFKSKGKVENLEKYCQGKDVSGSVGIAHTRWATHGEPSDVNAHPHYSQSETLALIHNGIIENYQTLKEFLIKEGYTFKSETDTEVLVQLIEYVKKKDNLDLFEAVQQALLQVVGAYAIGVIEKGKTDVLITARKGSPLVIGLGEGEYFLGSDASPIIEYTKKVIYVGDEEIAKIEKGKELEIVNLSKVKINPNITQINMDLSEIEKGGYPYFMIKEIMEQPKALNLCVNGRLQKEEFDIKLSGIIDNIDRFRRARRILISACGTSWHAGLIAKYLFEYYCKIPVEIEVASEFRYRNPVIFADDILIAISQSGETADTLAAIELAKEKGAFVYGVCNVVGSSIARATNSGTYTHAGPEIGVASTKAFTTQVMVLTMIALSVAKELKTIEQEEYKRIVAELLQVIPKVEEILKTYKEIEDIAKVFTYAKNFIYLGRGYNYPVALEGALKLKEISYIHAEGYPAAEMKHGPIALIDEEMPVVVIAPKFGHYDKILSNVQEVKARKGRVISIVTKGDVAIKALSDYCIEIPEIEENLSPLLTIIPLQLLSYYIAIAKGRNVDQPRNLAKSVTVE